MFHITFRANLYDMICAPFVYMNHHATNLMVGCGHIVNERIESFVSLFNSFLKSIDGVHLRTVMTLLLQMLLVKYFLT